MLYLVIASILIITAGIYCIIATRNLIRVLIAMEIVSKAAILIFLLGGLVSGRMDLAQGFIITIIIIEVVITAIGAVLAIAIHERTGSLDIGFLTKKKEGSTNAE